MKNIKKLIIATELALIVMMCFFIVQEMNHSWQRKCSDVLTDQEMNHSWRRECSDVLTDTECHYYLDTYK